MTVEAVALRLGSVISRLSDANSQQCWNTASEKRQSEPSIVSLMPQQIVKLPSGPAIHPYVYKVTIGSFVMCKLQSQWICNF